MLLHSLASVNRPLTVSEMLSQALAVNLAPALPFGLLLFFGVGAFGVHLLGPPPNAPIEM